MAMSLFPFFLKAILHSFTINRQNRVKYDPNNNTLEEIDYDGKGNEVSRFQ